MKQMMIAGALVLALAATACNRADTRSARRSDSAVTADVKRDLQRQDIPGAIDVSVNNGTATLTGTVPDTAAKQKAQDVADNVNGVDRVVNNLRTTTAADAPMRPGYPANQPNAGYPANQPNTGINQPGMAPAPHNAPAPDMGTAPNQPNQPNEPAMR